MQCVEFYSGSMRTVDLFERLLVRGHAARMMTGLSVRDGDDG